MRCPNCNHLVDPNTGEQWFEFMEKYRTQKGELTPLALVASIQLWDQGALRVGGHSVLPTELRDAVWLAMKHVPPEESVPHYRELVQCIEAQAARIRRLCSENIKLERQRDEARKLAIAVWDQLEDTDGEQGCDCRPEPENEGHVCNTCRIKLLKEEMEGGEEHERAEDASGSAGVPAKELPGTA